MRVGNELSERRQRDLGPAGSERGRQLDMEWPDNNIRPAPRQHADPGPEQSDRNGNHEAKQTTK